MNTNLKELGLIIGRIRIKHKGRSNNNVCDKYKERYIHLVPLVRYPLISPWEIIRLTERNKDIVVPKITGSKRKKYEWSNTIKSTLLVQF